MVSKYLIKNYRASGMFRATRNALETITSRIPDQVEHTTKNPFYAYTLVGALNAFRRSHAMKPGGRGTSLAGAMPLIRILVNISLSERMHQIVERTQRMFQSNDDADTVLVHTREIVRQKFPRVTNLRFLNAALQKQLHPGTPLVWALMSQIVGPYFITGPKRLKTIRTLQDAAVIASMLKVYEGLPRQERIAAVTGIAPELRRIYSKERSMLRSLYGNMIRRMPR
jgi:hypothetical protein